MTQRMTAIGGLTVALNFGLSRGFSLDQLCETIGLDPLELGDPFRMIPFAITERLWRHLVARLPDENVGVGMAMQARPEVYGVAGQLLKQAPDGLELLQMMVRSGSVSDTALIGEPSRVELQGDEVHVHFPKILSAGIPERTEAMWVLFATMRMKSGGPPEVPRRAYLSYPWSPTRELAKRALGCPVTWDAPSDVIVLDHASLRAPLPFANREARASFDDFITKREKLVPGVTLAERVRHTLRQQVARGDLTQQATARALGMSVRSLQRELQQVALRYSDLLGEAVREVGTSRMRADAQRIEDIAHELGYSESSSFARSWKRLTGESPARTRMRLRGAGDALSAAPKRRP